jgi:hypothetical protein
VGAEDEQIAQQSLGAILGAEREHGDQKDRQKPGHAGVYYARRRMLHSPGESRPALTRTRAITMKVVHYLRPLLALLCALVISPAAQTPQPAKSTLKEQVVLIPQGSVIEVVLLSREKLRGRIGAVSDTGFDLQRVQNDQTILRTFRYDEVKSVKIKGRGMSTAAKITIGALAGAGAVFLVLILVATYALN